MVQEKCIVCNIPSNGKRCRVCHEVWRFCSRLRKRHRKDYVLVVDGSFTMYPKPNGHTAAGAGLVLATADSEAVLAYCSASFLATSSDDTELEAIKRGHAWAPLDVVWSDSNAAIRLARDLNINAEYIRPHNRDPLHNLAHKLANIGRLGDWERLERIWIPGEVWP